MKKVFITGANGFVGGHLIEQLRTKYSIIGLAGSDKIKPADSHNVSFVVCDISSSQLTEVIKEHRPDMIIHLAAITQTWFDDPEKVLKVNLLGTINLYESVLKVKQQSEYYPKILYVSSSEIYGKTKNPYSIDEEAPLYPVNHYAASKLSADRLSYAYTQLHKLNIVIARPFTHTGPGQKEGFFVPDMVSQIVKIERDSSDSRIYVGNLDSVRDYLNVQDVVRAYQLLLETKTQPGEAFNICSGEGVRVRDLLNKMLKMSDKKIDIIPDPARMRPSDVPVFVGSNQKLRETTGWEPQVSLDDTLQTVMEYWRQNH